MSFLDILKTVYFNLKSNKGRSILSILGIVAGVASVVVIISSGAGAQGLILNQIKEVGTDVISIMPGKSEEKGPPLSIFGIVITTLTKDDAEAIEKEASGVISAVPVVKGNADIVWEQNSVNKTFVGTAPAYQFVHNLDFDAGRFFTEEEEKSSSKAVVIGSSVRNDLFGSSDPIGQRIKIKKETFTVIGVLKAKGSSIFNDADGQVYVPLTVAQNSLLGIKHVNNIIVKFSGSAGSGAVIEGVKNTLRERHKISGKEDDDFTINNPQQALSILTTVTDAVKFFLAGVAAISLVVGGIGIMNIMLISVTERTREIGLRKALGATRKNILLQFLLETVTISSLGGLIGITIGIITTFAIAIAAQYLKYDWDFIISAISIILAVSVSFITGLAFGLWPAYQAAKKEPMEALRYE